MTTLLWWKSSRSDSQGGACVEVATTETTGLSWWKTSRSDSQGGNCVEVAAAEATWYVRDSKDPDGGMLAASAIQWRSFVDAVRAGTLD